jgi:glycosyltransferase involved in cell wall biosynthesis
VRILFLTHYFPPEVNAPAVRTFEHCREWVAAGHDVHVVTCVPSHPLGEAFPGYRRRWYQYELLDGIHTHRVWTHLAANAGVFRRTLNYLSFVPTAAYRALRVGPIDVVVGTSPQFFCAVAACVAARLRGIPWVFELRDLWPESISAVGAMRRSVVLSLLERLELRLYRDAAAVACVTRSFMQNLAARGVDPAKLYYVPNGIEPEFWTSGDRARGRRRLGVADADVLVSYVGTIGMAHGLTTLLDAAERLRDSARHVRFLVVGDGAQLTAIREIAATRNLHNVSFTGLVAHDRVPSVLAASDVLLVTLKRADVFKTVLPSKMFEAMAASRPVVLAVDGEARAVLEASGGGVSVPPEDAEALAAAILLLARDPGLRASMGAAGRRHVELEFNRRTWAHRYLALLGKLGFERPIVAASEPAATE